MANQKDSKLKEEKAEDSKKEAKGKPSRAERKKDAKEKLSRGAKIALVAVGCAAMLLSVSAMACSGVMNEARNKEDYKLTGGVAATVNGTNITEDTITKQVMSYRTSAGLEKDKDWAQFLVGQGMTPESYRENMIRSLSSDFLMQSAIKEYDIKVTEDDVNKAFDDAAANYGGKDEMLKTLSQIGYTEDSYKQGLRSSIEQQKLHEKVAGKIKISDQEILDYFNGSFDSLNDARRSSNLLVKVEEGASEEDQKKAEAKAQEALDKINSGKMSFEDAVKEYSDDTGSKQQGGDVGWDKLTTFVTEYQTALSGLSKGQISGLVKTGYGYHIIKCTDVFKLDAPASSVDQLPAEYKDYIKSNLESTKDSEAYNKWLVDYTAKADIKINPMPKDVPYNVSLKGVKAETPQGSAQQ